MGIQYVFSLLKSFYAKGKKCLCHVQPPLAETAMMGVVLGCVRSAQFRAIQLVATMPLPVCCRSQAQSQVDPRLGSVEVDILLKSLAGSLCFLLCFVLQAVRSVLTSAKNGILAGERPFYQGGHIWSKEDNIVSTIFCWHCLLPPARRANFPPTCVAPSPASMKRSK